MKNVVVISGSPRPKGNTYKIVKEIENNMCRNNNVAFNYVSLKRLHLEYCKGCLRCMKKGETFCPCKDDALQLRDTLLTADGVVFASPVYVHTVSAMLKNFYDRFAYMCHQSRFRDKTAMFVVTTELSGAKECLEYMRFPAFTWGFRMSSELDVVYDAYLKPGSYRDKVKSRIAQTANTFYQDMTTPRCAPSFKELVFFHLMKRKVTFHKDMLPYDYRYWEEQGWLSRCFYTEDNVPSFKNGLARRMVTRKVRGLLQSYGLSQ